MLKLVKLDKKYKKELFEMMDEWTNSGMPDRMRYFCMGNALVVPMITRMGNVLDEIIAAEI